LQSQFIFDTFIYFINIYLGTIEEMIMFGINSLCRNKKGQGALEYLLIIGGAILVAVIVIMVIVSMGSTSRSTANETANQSKTITSTTLSSIPTIISIEPDNSSCLNNVGGNFTLNWLPQSQAGVYTISVKDSLGSDLNVISLSTGTSNLNTSVLSDTINLAIGSNNCSDTFKVKIEAAKDNQVVESIPSNFNWQLQSSNVLRAYWDFSEGSGATLGDRSGNGNNSNIMGAIWSTTPLGKPILRFNGTSNYVNRVSAANMNFAVGQDITISMWVYTSTATLNGRTVICAGSATECNIGVRFVNSGGINYAAALDNWANQRAWINYNSFTNQWHNITYVYKRSIASPVVYGYLDGSYISTGANLNNNLLSLTGQAINIGKRWDASSFFSGNIGDVRIIGRALTAGEVKSIYDNTKVYYQ